ncbi:Scarecrow-like protein 1 [Hibiscus syriacus]|uniref:Scarecrow-like protein 1 n=1 Tax=Hibiscus syriacus TaxID=106335 RepID=A0A6A3CES3_HIBSY|nr:Scarecrow-like protein 1 [Hibiscus syriacus]
MSLVRSAEPVIVACRNTKLCAVQGSGNSSGLSAQMFGSDKQKTVHYSYCSESYEKYFDDFPSEELTHPSGSDVLGSSFRPQDVSSDQLREPIHESPEELLSSDISGNKEVSHVSSRTPKQMLIECAAVLSEGNVELASAMINELRLLVSIKGDPPQRIAAYMVEGLQPCKSSLRIDDPDSVQRLNGGLKVIGLRLEKLAEVLGVSLEFHAVASRTSLVTPYMLDCRSGEELVVNFAFQLHHMPDESVSTVNQRDHLLRMVKSLNPKLVTVVEQDVNTNTSPSFPRFIEACSYYSAVFESLDATLPRERKWRARMMMAGFTSCPMSPNVIDIIRKLIREYFDRYKLKEDLGALHFGWQGKSLIVASAWR